MLAILRMATIMELIDLNGTSESAEISPVALSLVRTRRGDVGGVGPDRLDALPHGGEARLVRLPDAQSWLVHVLLPLPVEIDASAFMARIIMIAHQTTRKRC